MKPHYLPRVLVVPGLVAFYRFALHPWLCASTQCSQAAPDKWERKGFRLTEGLERVDTANDGEGIVPLTVNAWNGVQQPKQAATLSCEIS